MSHKPGAILYDAAVDEGRIVIDEYVCRSIRRGRAFYTLKNFVTWGKLSKRHGDYGWLDPIADVWRKRIPVNGNLPTGMGRSKQAAIRSYIASMRAVKRKWPDDDEIDTEIAIATRALKRYSRA